jgi:hypothetical protein
MELVEIISGASALWRATSLLVLLLYAFKDVL